VQVGRHPTLDDLPGLAGCQDAQSLRAHPWYIVRASRLVEDALAVQPDVSSSHAAPVAAGLAGEGWDTWRSALSLAAAGVHIGVIEAPGGRERLVTLPDLVAAARLAEVAWATAARRCGRAWRCLCHPRSMLVHGWQVELIRNPVLWAFPVDFADVAVLVCGVAVAPACAWLRPPVLEV
jgi:hypothetical protein